MKLSFFISYSRRDEHLVYRYADDIKKHLNVTTWLDKDDIPTGSDWWNGICDGIHDSDFFMFFLSPHSATSTYCMAELRYAHALNKVVLPIMIAETTPLPSIIDENRINYYNLTNYKDSRDVLLSLSKDIFHHLTHPRPMTDIAPPQNPDDNSSSAVSKPAQTQSTGNPREQFAQAEQAMAKGEYALAHNLFQQVINGNIRVLARKAKKSQEQVKPLIPLQEASHALTEILSVLGDGFISQAEAQEEYVDFLEEYIGFDYPPMLEDVQAEPYQTAYHEIIESRNEEAIELQLRTMELKHIPPEIGLLFQLTLLELYNNPLTGAPESIGNLSKLTSLGFSYNQLTSVPENIGDLAQLTSLVLGGNQLTSVPESIVNLSQLTSLNLHNNQLTSVPESIVNLSQLTRLYLDDNQLTSVPDWIGNLSQLRELSLRSNQMTNLPISIGLLSKLKYFMVDGNPLTDLPDHVERTDKAILAWLQDEARKL